MSKALQGIAAFGGAIAMGGAAFLDPALLASPLFDKIWAGLVLEGIALEAGALADALTSNRGMSITTRQPAGNRLICYGEQRIGGVLVYHNTTGSHHDQDNRVIIICGHEIDGVVALYLDGRQVFFTNESPGSDQCPGGYRFGGQANGTKYYDAGGHSYNFGGLVYCSAVYGDQTSSSVSYVNNALAANDPTWTASTSGVPWGAGLAWCYLKYEYDTVTFPSEPEIKFTIRGKNDIYDPRTSTTGYTTNWALCVANFLCNAEFGFGCSMSEINTAQLIAAANICDELVPLANGTSEPRYTFNASWDTSTAPGDALAAMLKAAAGNVYFSSGQYYIVPASAPTASASFNQDDLLEDIQWAPYRSIDALFNEVRGTFTCPNYPYSPAGNLYGSDGRDPDGYFENNFNYAWQKTSFPPYAQDTLHGYAYDQFYEADGNYKLVTQLDLPGTISLATAQRLAKIHLMMNRRQGSGMLTIGLQAIAVAPYDVISLSYIPYGWVNKQLQVTSWQLCSDTDGSVPRWYIQLGVREYDPTDLSWSITEELSILDQPIATQFESEIAQVPEYTLNTGPGYDFTNADGVVIPRVEVLWSDPPDVRVTLIDVQWIVHGSGAWLSIPPTPVGVGVAYFTGPVAGTAINVRVRGLTGNGAASAWLEADNLNILTGSVSSITSIGVSPGIPWNVTNDATIDSIAGTGSSAGSAIVRVYGAGGPGTAFDVFTGSGSYTLPAATLVYPYSSSGFLICSFVFHWGGPTGISVYGPSFSIVSTYEQTIGDTIILIGSFTTIASSGSGGSTGGGGSGGGGTGGPRGPSCTVEGTALDTPDGPVSNIILAHQHSLGVPTYLIGADGKPERITRAEWVWQSRHQVLQVGDVTVLCSDTHTVSVDGAHKPCSLVPSGTAIDTRTGLRAMTRTSLVGNARVLKLTIEGPSHIYSASGVLTHNTSKNSTE